MSAAKQRLNLFNFEFNYTFERHSPLWAGTGACPYILFRFIEICSNKRNRRVTKSRKKLFEKSSLRPLRQTLRILRLKMIEKN
jgi:hypothetical protein